MWIRVWGLIEKDGKYIVWQVRWLEDENGTYGATKWFSDNQYCYNIMYVYKNE